MRRYILPLLVLALAAGYAAFRSEQKVAPVSETPVAAATGATSTATASTDATGTASNTAAAADESPVTGRFQKIASLPGIEGIIVSDPQGDVDLGRYKGKALLVNVWATWCPPCVAEMPSLDRLQAKLGSNKFAVVPVAVDEPNMAAVQAFIDQKQLHNLPVLLDLNHAIDHKIRLQALPASLLVSPEGIILARFSGDNKWDCGAPLAAIEAFIKDGTVPDGELNPCPN